jgi:hypothetical protein
MGERIRIRVDLDAPAGVSAAITLRGQGPSDLSFEGEVAGGEGGRASITLASHEELPRAIARIPFDIAWSADGASVTPESVSMPLYVTMGRPNDEPRAPYLEDGVTLRRMDKAVEWSSALETLDPHGIVEGLLARFPHYALLPSPDVPPEYDHPRYFNNLGGAWPMVDYVAASGECQAIVRLVRGMLAQLGVPGETRVLVVWADPEVSGGEKPIVADWETDPHAGLSRRKTVDGRELVAALVDSPVVEGRVYPPSHTLLPDGTRSPGLNRYEACLAFTQGGRTRYYCGGVGVLSSRRQILRVFWGLVWVEFQGDEGFRVERIVRRYRGGE